MRISTRPTSEHGHTLRVVVSAAATPTVGGRVLLPRPSLATARPDHDSTPHCAVPLGSSGFFLSDVL